MKGTVAIAGAGVIGRLIAHKLHETGWQVSLWDRGNEFGCGSCSYAAAGMLSPYCELENSEELICQLGEESLEQWPQIIRNLPLPVYLQREGSLCIAHAQDRNELLHLKNRVLRSRSSAIEEVSGSRLAELEPELGNRFHNALFFLREGQIDNRQLLSSLAAQFRQWGLRCHFKEEVLELGPHRLTTRERIFDADWVLDCRGLGAKPDLPNLRGVRGELILIEAPEVSLKRPIRLFHPRYSVYIVPRPGSRYLVGATLIESEDRGPITVRSTLELLSAAFSVHSGFSEARVLESVVHCRPAFSDNLPRIQFQKGLLRVNGMYRHGFLIAPKISEIVVDILGDG